MRVIQLPLDGNGSLWGGTGVVPRIDGRMYANGALWYSVQTVSTAPTYVGSIVPPSGDNAAVGGGYKVNNHKLAGFTPDGCAVVVFEAANPGNVAQWGVFAGILGPSAAREPGGGTAQPVDYTAIKDEMHRLLAQLSAKVDQL